MSVFQNKNTNEFEIGIRNHYDTFVKKGKIQQNLKKSIPFKEMESKFGIKIENLDDQEQLLFIYLVQQSFIMTESDVEKEEYIRENQIVEL